MNIEIVRLNQYPGNKSIIYSIIIDDHDETLFEQFVEENIETNLEELQSIDNRLRVMNEVTGAREQYFKINEGKLGDGVAAIYDLPSKKLRLYCLRFGTTTIILGGGGLKRTRTYQEDKKLHTNVKILSDLSKRITTALKEKDIKLEEDGSISGTLKLEE